MAGLQDAQLSTAFRWQMIRIRVRLLGIV